MISTVLRQLKKDRNRLDQQLTKLTAAIAALSAGPARRGKPGPKPARKRRKMSAAARRKIGAAQRARWAKLRAAKKQ
jgi:hypothetical protein